MSLIRARKGIGLNECCIFFALKIKKNSKIKLKPAFCVFFLAPN